jgi:hypothetical protein
VHAVGPHVHVVAVGQVAGAEGGVVVLPLLGQPGDRGRRQTGGGAEELLQGGHEVAGGQPVQVQQRQHLADLDRLAAPRREDLGGEPHPLTGGPIDALVVDARGGDLHGPGRGGHGAGAVVAVADHQAAAGLVLLGGQLGDVLIDLGL